MPSKRKGESDAAYSARNKAIYARRSERKKAEGTTYAKERRDTARKSIDLPGGRKAVRSTQKDLFVSALKAAGKSGGGATVVAWSPAKGAWVTLSPGAMDKLPPGGGGTGGAGGAGVKGKPASVTSKTGGAWTTDTLRRLAGLVQRFGLGLLNFLADNEKTE